jgi:hypothetical protein
MKLANVKVGMEVLVKDKGESLFLERNLGRVGVVNEVVADENRIWLKFEDGDLDYGNPRDLKRVKGQSQ